LEISVKGVQHRLFGDKVANYRDMSYKTDENDMLPDEFYQFLSMCQDELLNGKLDKIEIVVLSKDTLKK
jgi:hypothetical protein